MTRDYVRKLNKRAVSRNSDIEREEALLALLERSIRLGHRRLTVRRILMLRACSIEVPQELAPHCLRLMTEIDRKELSQISQSVHEWILMLRPRNVDASQA